MNYAYVNRGRHLYECLIHASALELLVFFTFIFNVFFFWKNSLIKSIIQCRTVHAFGLFTYVCQASLPLFLTRVSVVIFCFRSMPNGNRLFSSESLSLVPDKWLVHKLRVMATVELHLNATYYAHHPTLKSVYEKKTNM